MTDKNSSEASEGAASAAPLEEGIGAATAGLDPVRVASLAFNASAADPAVARELGGFLRDQRELAGRQRIVADKLL